MRTRADSSTRDRTEVVGARKGLSELEYVRAACSGDQHAFQQLYQRYRRTVRCVVLASVGWQEADDLTQDVFLRAWQRMAQLREPERFAAWLMQCARNRCVDHHRQSRARAEMPVRGAPMAPRAEALEALRAIQGLPESYRETLVMRLIEGMSGPEIAERTGLTPRSVRVNLHRGMKKLRAALGEGESA